MADYAVLGHWLHFTGDMRSLSVTGVEMGTFVDGPELSSANPPNMPVRGQAVYSGPTSGVYVGRYGADAAALFGASVGSGEVGAFTSTIDLTASFAQGTISGCVGCRSGVLLSGIFVDAATGQASTFENVSSPTRVHLGPASFGSDGAFRNRDVTVESSLYQVASSSGAWGGRFSNILDSNGDPRLVAGTYGGEGTSAGGSEAAFVGAFGVPRQ